MAPDEASEVNDLVLRGNEENLAAFPADVAASYRGEILRLAGRASPSVRVYVAELEERVVGTVTLLPDAADDLHPWPAGAAVLRFLAVDHAARRLRLGEMLTSLCIEEARRAGASVLALHTAPVMVAARRMYERLGFTRAPEHDFDAGVHYGDGTPGRDPVCGLAYVLRLRSVA